MTTAPPASWPAQPSSSLHVGRRVLYGVLFLLLAAEAWVVGPYAARAAGTLGHTNLRWLALALSAEFGSLVALARLQRRMLSAGGLRVPLASMIGLTYAANAISATLPAGSALSSGYVFRRLRSFGASAPLAGFTLIASGVLSTVAFALLALTGGFVLGVDRTSHVGLIAEFAAAGGLIYLVRRAAAEPKYLHRGATVMLGWSNRALRRPVGTSESVVHDFLHKLTEIKPRRRDWAAGLVFSGANWLTDLVCLAASCRAVGLHVSVLVVMVAFLAGATVSSLSVLPGGVGVIDAAMIAALTRGGLSIASAAAAVVLYRLISFVLMVGIGWLAWTLNWGRERRLARSDTSRRLPASEARPPTGRGSAHCRAQLYQHAPGCRRLQRPRVRRPLGQPVGSGVGNPRYRPRRAHGRVRGSDRPPSHSLSPP